MKLKWLVHHEIVLTAELLLAALNRPSLLRHSPERLQL